MKLIDRLHPLRLAPALFFITLLSFAASFAFALPNVAIFVHENGKERWLFGNAKCQSEEIKEQQSGAIVSDDGVAYVFHGIFCWTELGDGKIRITKQNGEIRFFTKDQLQDKREELRRQGLLREPI